MLAVWTIVAACALANMLAWSVRATFALFYVALLEHFGWPRGAAAVGYSLSWLLVLAFGPLAGRLHDRLGAHVVMPVAGLVLGAALALTGRAETLGGYYAAFGVLGAAGIAGVMMPAAAVVTAQVPRARGAALGVVSAGASVSAFVFYPVNAALIARLGWRDAITVYGVLVTAGVALAAGLVHLVGGGRTRPSGVRADEAGARPRAASASGGGEGATLRGALRTRAFWSVFVMWGLGVIGYQIMVTHQVAHARDRGLDPATVAWVLGLAGLFTAAGNVLGGVLSDRWGRGAVFVAGSVIGLAGIAVFAALDGPGDVVRLFLYAAAGVGFGMRIAMLTAIPADLFHGRHFGAILGLANGGGGLGGFIGPFLGGWLHDVTGSYGVAFSVAGAAVAGSAVAAWVATSRRR